MLFCMWPVVHNARFVVARNAPAPGVLPEADVLCVITTEKGHPIRKFRASDFVVSLCY